MRAPSQGTFIDLFAGCGGLSLGLMAAGWRGLLAVEKDPLAFGTLRHNLIRTDEKPITPHEKPIAPHYDWPDWFPQEATTIGRFISKYGEMLQSLAGSVDLVAGGPPCQGFSFAGKRDRNDRRNLLTEKYYIEIVRLVRPSFVLLENVKGMAIEFRKKRRTQARNLGRPPKSFSRRVQEDLEAAGYEVHVGTVKALDFGVAQRRPRHIVIGVRRDLLREGERINPFTLLLERRIPFLASKGLPALRPITARQAISDLEARGEPLIECPDSRGAQQVAYGGPRTSYQRLLHGQMNGQSPNSLRLAMHGKRVVTRFTRMLRECRRGVKLSPKEKKVLGTSKHQVAILDGDEPSHTLTTLPDDLLHYSEPRVLTVRECARLQSFPDWYEFKGKYCTGGPERKHQAPRYTQVGNAVPPFVAEALGLALQDLRHRLQGEPDGRAALLTGLAACL
jgi:DNA (cytosine-5)-methyltransferase 1